MAVLQAARICLRDAGPGSAAALLAAESNAQVNGQRGVSRSMSTPQAQPGSRETPPFPFVTLAKVLAVPLIAVAVFLLLMRFQPRDLSGIFEHGRKRVDLLQKDAKFQPIPPGQGGATGSVWYTPSGPQFGFKLEAKGLKPGKRYLTELAVDENIYTLTSHAADSDGKLAIDTTLTAFAEGVCVGPNYDPPRPLDGAHTIRFWVKADGNPPSGSGRIHSAQFKDGQDLPCSGNGDGDYTYVLLENEAARYAGPGAPASPDS
jgi:hypothetical protein